MTNKHKKEEMETLNVSKVKKKDDLYAKTISAATL